MHLILPSAMILFWGFCCCQGFLGGWEAVVCFGGFFWGVGFGFCVMCLVLCCWVFFGGGSVWYMAFCGWIFCFCFVAVGVGLFGVLFF